MLAKIETKKVVLVLILLFFLIVLVLKNNSEKIDLGLGLNVNWFTFSKVFHWIYYWENKNVSVCKLIKDLGFEHVRIRLDYNILEEERIKLLDKVIKDCIENKVFVILAYSAKDLLENPYNKTYQEKFIKFWKILAKRYKGIKKLAFDLIIEPGKKLKENISLEIEILKRAFREIREIDGERLIIIPSPYSSKPSSLKYLNFLDKNSMAEWHIYAKGPCKKLNKIYYNNASNYFYFNISLIYNSFLLAYNFTKKAGIKTYFGAIRFNCYPKFGRKLYNKDKSPKGLYSFEKIKGFIEIICKLSKKFKIPIAINSGDKYIDYEKLRVFPSKEEEIKFIIERCK